MTDERRRSTSFASGAGRCTTRTSSTRSSPFSRALRLTSGGRARPPAGDAADRSLCESAHGPACRCHAAPATSAVPDDVLAFVSLSRLASGDHTRGGRSGACVDAAARQRGAVHAGVVPPRSGDEHAGRCSRIGTGGRGLPRPLDSDRVAAFRMGRGESPADRQLRSGARSRCRRQPVRRRCRAPGRAARERQCRSSVCSRSTRRGPRPSPTTSAGSWR